MASTYSPLKIELIGTGEQVATWGQTTNTNLGTAIEQAIGGKADVTMSSTTETLTLTDTNAAQNARALYLNLTGTPGGAAVLEVPAVQKAYIVKNATTGGFAVTVKVAGQTGVSVPNGATMHLYNNGTDVVNAITNLPAGATIGGAAISSASGTVSSVAAGNGMSFSTITTTGSVTLGTPSTLSVSSTNNVAGSTHTHAITTASASTASTIVARDSLGGFEATTISMTTGNISTLNVGNQTNKATISYTTNAARTLTIPAVAGNRTFAFLEEAQTYTANQTIGANLVFTGNDRRITGPMSNTLVSERLTFQTSAVDNVTIIGAIPSGSGTESRLSLFNTTSATDYSALDLRCTASENIIRSQAFGVGTYLPLIFINNISERMRLTSDGELMIAGNTDQGAYNLQVNGTGVWAAGDYVNGSDAKIKKNVQTLPAALDIIEKLRPVTFEYRTDIGYTNDKGVHVGFVAQDLQEALAGKEYANTVVRDGGKYLSVSYQSIIPMLVKAVQELTERVKQLENK